MRRHLIVPDTQIRPGVSTDHIDWAARAIVDYLPDVIVVIGDWWDMPSLSMHEPKGSMAAEGRRYEDDVKAGNEAFARLVAPMQAEIARRIRNKTTRWRPECHFLFGNHEHRIQRAVETDPRYAGTIGDHHLLTPGFERHPFLRIVEIDGIAYCHYFPNPLSGKPIGGTIVNRLNHIGKSFVQGHQQGSLYASKQYPDHVKHGLVCGRFYAHHEAYRPDDVQLAEWNGIVVLNEVRVHAGHGSYDLMPLSYGYLQRKYGDG